MAPLHETEFRLVRVDVDFGLDHFLGANEFLDSREQRHVGGNQFMVLGNFAQ